MSYIDAHHDRNSDVILVSERVNGKRIIRELQPVYEFYYEDELGSVIATTGERAKLVSCKRMRDFQKELKSMGSRKLFESDHNIVFKTLKKYYQNVQPANLHVSFFDIEVDFDLKKGYSTPEDPFNPVTAVSVFNVWMDTLFTLVIKPETLTEEEAQRIVVDFPNTILCANEKELLMMFQDIIEDADVISGWNSEGYDVPYMLNRTIQELGKTSTSGWCLFGMQPVKTKYERFGKEQLTFTLKGRLHIDYLELYKKHTPKTQESYKLDFIGNQEVGEQKVQYEGTLYQLYREDFRKFIDYNRQDTMLLSKIDSKLKYLDLANQIAIQNYVLIPSTMGTVAWVDQSIINEAHERGMVVPTKPKDEELSSSAAGAWVADPEFGLQEWIGCVDINSLYPSTIRLLNMSPETIVAQIRDDFTQEFLEERIAREDLWVSVKGIRMKNYTEAWNGLFGTVEFNMVLEQSATELTVDFCDGTTQKMSAKDLYGMIFQPDSGLNISANGTIFRTDIDGLIPGLLARWYTERQEMQAKAKEFKNEAEVETDPDKKKELMKQFTFWNMRQQIRKIQLNSLYGSLLQKGSKFYDKRMGQSVTLTGRCITRHMAAKINEIVTGNYDYTGDAIVYGDTDSLTPDSMVETEDGRMTIAALYDHFSGAIISDNENTEKKIPLGEFEVLSYDEMKKEPTFRELKRIHRHKVSKPKWKLVTESGKEIIVTGDHSLVVLRNGRLVEVRPSEVNPESDQVVTL